MHCSVQMPGAHLFLARSAAGDPNQQVEHGHGAVVDAQDDVAKIKPELSAA
jgi:hypothetical protein